MKNSRFLHSLQCIIVYYCNNNFVNYQQGLLQVTISLSFKIAVPFVLLKSQQKYKLKVCYGLFQNFMTNYFPSMLTQKIVNNKKQLPMTAVSLNLMEVLLNYMYPQVFYHLKSHNVPLSMIFTAELMTVFAKNIKIELVYDIWAFFIQQCKKMAIKKQNRDFYYTQLIVLLAMGLGLVGLCKEQLLQQSQEQIFQFLQKSLKKFNKKQDFKPWFETSLYILQKIPRYFYKHTSRILGLTTKAINGIRTVELYEQMMKKQNQSLSYLIEKEDIADFQNNESQSLLIIAKNNQSFKGLRNNKKNQVLELQKIISSKENSSQNDIFVKILDEINKITHRKKLSHLLIVIQQIMGNKQDGNIDLLQKIIKDVQLNLSLKCFKIKEQNLIRNTIVKQTIKEKNSSKCYIF